MLRRYFNFYRESVQGIPRSARVLCCVAFLNFLGYMVMPFLGLYLTSQKQMSLTTAAWLLSSYGLGAVAGSYFGGSLCNRFVPQRVMLVGLFLSGLFLSLLWVPSDPRLLALLIFTVGVTSNSFRPALNVALSEACNESERAKAYALYRVMINIASCLGISLGAFLSTKLFYLLCLLDGASSLAAAALLYFYRADWRTTLKTSEQSSDAQEAKSPQVIGNRSPWMNLPFIAMCSIILFVTVVDFQQNSTYPIYLTQMQGMSEVEYGSLFVLGTLMIVLFEIPLIEILKRYDTALLSGLGALLLCLGPALLLFGGGVSFVVISFVIWSLGDMILWPSNLSYLSSRIENDPLKGTYYGIYGGIFSLCHLLAPPLGMALYSEYSPRTLWVLCGIVGVVAAFAFLALAPRGSLSLAFKKQKGGVYV